MAVIADMSTMTFQINVDELDISNMSTGQQVDITADALPDKQFTGYVDKVGLLGTSEQGVTSYPVTIVINDPEELWPGMNVTADIIVDSAEDVLVVPVDAINRGNTVMLQDGTQAKVTIGIKHDRQIEITEGLKEGDVILVAVQAATASEGKVESISPTAMPSGGGSSGGGGMPSDAGGGGGGNRPSGGAPGGM